VDYRRLFRGVPGELLVLSTELRIVDATETFLQMSGRRREEIVGRPLFEVFPDNPNDPDSTGVRNLRSSLERVLREGVMDVMAVQRYDVQRPEDGGEFEERYWVPSNAPVLGPENEVLFIVHRVQEVTDFFVPSGVGTEGEGGGRTAAEVYQRAQALQEANRRLRVANEALVVARDEARAARERATEVLESISDGFVTLDREWRFTYANRETERMTLRHLGLSARELIGRSIWDVLPEMRGTEFEARYRGARESRRSTHFEAYYEPLRLWLSVRAYPSREGLSIYFLDVTERKRAEMEDSLLRTLALRIGGAPDLPSALEVMLRQVRRATGWTAGELWMPQAGGAALVQAASDSAGGAEVKRFHAESAAIAILPEEGLVGRVWRERRAIWLPEVILHLSGRRRALAEEAGLRAGAAVPVLSGDEVVAVMAFHHTEARPEDPHLVKTLTRVASELGRLIARRRDQAALQELNREIAERDRLLTVAGRVAHLGGWTIDLKDRIVHWSDEVCAIHDAPPGTKVTLEEGVADYAPEWRPVIAEHVRACAEEGVPYDLELEKVTRKGRRVWVRTIGEAERSADGTIVRIQGAFQDITERRKAEALLRRTERLASVGTLVGGVAHELNNPLHAVRNFAELMLLEERGEEDREALEIIRREADRAAKVVSDLRQLARETQEGEGARTAVDLNEIVGHMVKVRRYSLETGNVEIREDLAGNLPAVLANRSEIEQVVLNLLVNAEQAMAAQEEPRRLILRTRRTPDGATIHVVDSGPGIPPQYLERIFDPFFTTKSPGEGTGLGLALVHNIVTEHGGQIHVESEPGKGTAFRIDLPRAPGPVRAPSPGGKGFAAAARSLRILVVDDEEPIRLVSTRFLEHLGHRVEAVADGNEALRRWEEGEYDLILSDLRMPGLCGEELIERLRARGRGLERRLIVVTGDVASTRAARLVSEAGIPVLVKPVRLEDLARAVDHAVQAREG
jgi:PAS domain S-box-containing protein